MHRLTHTFVLVAALATAAVFAAGALAGGGNSASAKLCQKDGWKWAVDSTGGAFANADDCVAYSARGGDVFRPVLTAEPSHVVEEQGIVVKASGFHASSTGVLSIQTLPITGIPSELVAVTNAAGELTASSVFTAGACAAGRTGATFTYTDGSGVHASASVTLDCS